MRPLGAVFTRHREVFDGCRAVLAGLQALFGGLEADFRSLGAVFESLEAIPKGRASDFTPHEAIVAGSGYGVPLSEAILEDFE